ncbi:MAG: hypothetical protein E5W06_00335 [Mesorhizobium sp.]|nr:MAG: hypothetical protein E5W06_00335 [Mesorhizobium sp.]
MTNNLAEKMNRCIAIMDERGEDNEFVLRFMDFPEWTAKNTGVVTPRRRVWSAELSNPSQHVCLGEIEAVYNFEGSTPDEAVDALLIHLDELRRDMR